MFLGTGKALILHDEGYQQVQGHTESTVQAGAGITVVSGSELNDYLTNTNSGSGSGLPLLVQRSVARQVFMFFNSGGIKPDLSSVCLIAMSDRCQMLLTIYVDIFILD